MIIINKINYIKDDLHIELFMNGGFVLRVWADQYPEECFKALHEFREKLNNAIACDCKFVTIPNELNVKTWSV